MIIVVNEASILIDMLEIKLSDEFFHLPYEMHTTDLVGAEIKGKISKRFQKCIRRKTINIHNLSSEKMDDVVNLNDSYPPLSIQECSCLWLCQHLSATLLTGDNKLKEIASGVHIPVHGTIWVFDQLISQGETSPRTAANKLRELMKINKWLPKKECRKKIKEWES